MASHRGGNVRLYQKSHHTSECLPPPKRTPRVWYQKQDFRPSRFWAFSYSVPVPLSYPSPPPSDWVPLECPLPIWVYTSYTSHSVFPWSPTYLHTGPVQQRECGRSSSHIGLGSRQTTQDMHMQDGKHKIRSSRIQNKVIIRNGMRTKKHMMVRISN